MNKLATNIPTMGVITITYVERLAAIESHDVLLQSRSCHIKSPKKSIRVLDRWEMGGLKEMGMLLVREERIQSRWISHNTSQTHLNSGAHKTTECNTYRDEDSEPIDLRMPLGCYYRPRRMIEGKYSSMFIGYVVLLRSLFSGGRIRYLAIEKNFSV